MTSLPPPPSPEAEEAPAPFRVLGPASLTALVTIDERGKVVAWSTEAERVCGGAAAEAVGRRLSETIIPARYREAHEAGLQRMRETGAGPALGRVIEASALRRDGSEFDAEVSISPPTTRDDDGPRLITAFVRDLTERRRLEQVHAMHFEVTRILAESATLDAAAPAVLAAIGSNLGYGIGMLWVVDRAPAPPALQAMS